MSAVETLPKLARRLDRPPLLVRRDIKSIDAATKRGPCHLPPPPSFSKILFYDCSNGLICQAAATEETAVYIMQYMRISEEARTPQMTHFSNHLIIEKSLSGFDAQIPRTHHLLQSISGPEAASQCFGKFD